MNRLRQIVASAVVDLAVIKVIALFPFPLTSTWKQKHTETIVAYDLLFRFVFSIRSYNRFPIHQIHKYFTKIFFHPISGRTHTHKGYLFNGTVDRLKSIRSAAITIDQFNYAQNNKK